MVLYFSALDIHLVSVINVSACSVITFIIIVLLPVFSIHHAFSVPLVGPKPAPGATGFAEYEMPKET